MQKIVLQPYKKVYFASDFHLGVDGFQTSKERELLICSWLDHIKADAQIVFLCGDLFDFWFEYGKVVPKGFLRFFAKIIELQNTGIEFIFFTGNHDLWIKDYFTTELGIKVYHQPAHFQIDNHSFHIGHGDGLGPGDYNYKILKKVFTNPIAQFLFGWLHPDLGMRFGDGWSRSRKTTDRIVKSEVFEHESKEWILQYCKGVEAHNHYDFYIFGHRHLALNLPVTEASSYINLGEWFLSGKYHFGVFDGKHMQLVEYN